MDPEDTDDPDHSQNLITSSFYYFGHILKILSKFVHKFLSYLVHKQTDGRTDRRQTNPGENITSLAEEFPLIKGRLSAINVQFRFDWNDKVLVLQTRVYCHLYSLYKYFCVCHLGCVPIYILAG